MKPLPYCTAQMLQLMRNIKDDAPVWKGIDLVRHFGDAVSATVSRGWVKVDSIGELFLTDAGTTYLQSKEKK